MYHRGGSRIPRRRGCQPSGGANIQNCQIFPKPHEIKKILVRRGRPLGSTTVQITLICKKNFINVGCLHLIWSHDQMPTHLLQPIRERHYCSKIKHRTKKEAEDLVFAKSAVRTSQETTSAGECNSVFKAKRIK